eukprot:NODE_9817_length_1397_cov_6.000000.p1 GENE.NODE_9817_length_1397_cov_6.000000~~NODE_9817_length_1397_cov_6.000000.p1  ORF type:complete len:354 (+),score=57.12 NODE_9817_length_1397_cov_6.000000:80-1141(+)
MPGDGSSWGVVRTTGQAIGTRIRRMLGVPSGDRTGRRRSSSDTWAELSETIVLLDFDDTIFPTTWLCTNYRAEGQSLAGSQDPVIHAEVAKYIEPMIDLVFQFIVTCKSIGTVIIVTNAVPGWVNTIIKRYMPTLLSEFDEMRVVYARQVFADARKVRRMPETTMHWKVEAMQLVLAEHYGHKSWKNIISLGDGPDEYHALRAVAEKHRNPLSSNTGKRRPLRVKAVRFCQSPTLYELALEVELMMQGLPALVMCDGSCVINLKLNLAGTPLEHAMRVEPTLMASRLAYFDDIKEFAFDHITEECSKQVMTVLGQRINESDSPFRTSVAAAHETEAAPSLFIEDDAEGLKEES